MCHFLFGCDYPSDGSRPSVTSDTRFDPSCDRPVVARRSACAEHWCPPAVKPTYSHILLAAWTLGGVVQLVRTPLVHLRSTDRLRSRGDLGDYLRVEETGKRRWKRSSARQHQAGSTAVRPANPPAYTIDNSPKVCPHKYTRT